MKRGTYIGNYNKSKEECVIVSFNIFTSNRDKLKKLAHQQGLSTSYVLNKILNDNLK